MQIASVLSDLTSLRACSHDAALALIHSTSTSTTTLPIVPTSSSSTLKPETQGTAKPPTSTLAPGEEEEEEEDPDLQRALDLVELHSSVKVKHLQGMDLGLQRARGDVSEVLRKLRGERG
ncbi:MAG: hypothetical protein M1830_001435 [Pleopsidium flavum]|nr:MAG: hypothetical protein M1830_001435 [Pleopsidium flavum]